MLTNRVLSKSELQAQFTAWRNNWLAHHHTEPPAERDPTLDGDVGTQTVADARWRASARGAGASYDALGGLAPALGPSAAFCALPLWGVGYITC